MTVPFSKLKVLAAAGPKAGRSLLAKLSGAVAQNMSDNAPAKSDFVDVNLLKLILNKVRHHQ